MDDSARAYRARFVFRGSAPPLDGGVVTVAGGRVVGVGRRSDGAPPVDLGDVAILPGLVNTHVHLEFSDLNAPLGRPGMRFPDWIRSVIEHRQTTSSDALRAVVAGLDESLRLGTTTLGEIATGDWSSAPFEKSPLDCTIFQELIAIALEHIDDRLALARQHVARDRRLNLNTSNIESMAGQQEPSWHAGISPHAPYTVHPRLFSQLVQLAAHTGALLAMHLAESPEESKRSTSSMASVVTGTRRPSPRARDRLIIYRRSPTRRSRL